MKRLLCTCVAVILLAAFPAMAHWMTGNDLKELADIGEKSSEGWDQLAFGNYVIGVIDATSMKICIPQTATRKQCAEVVKKYLKEHPEQLHLPGAGIVINAIHTACPCKK
jgi:hypothetical protein